jgi:putative holliday junction resolvase
MGRILAIDYGIKRTGMAVSDETGSFAFALDTVATTKLQEYLLSYIRLNTVDAIVVGEPRKLNNEPTDATPHIEGFIRRLKKDFRDMKVFRVDERFTSSMALQAIIDSGVKKKDRKNKELIDQVSATIILQSWIAQQNK